MMKDKKIFCFWECEHYSYPEWNKHGCYIWSDDRGTGISIPLHGVRLSFMGSDDCIAKLALSMAHHNCPYGDKLISADDAMLKDDEV